MLTTIFQLSGGPRSLTQMPQAVPQDIKSLGAESSLGSCRAGQGQQGARSDSSWKRLFYSSSKTTRKSLISINSFYAHEVFILLLWRWQRVVYQSKAETLLKN